VTLIGGDPGIGKSTLLLQAAARKMARDGADSVAYIRARKPLIRCACARAASGSRQMRRSQSRGSGDLGARHI
jgi:predicted ATP-dependent serine protease